MYTYIYIYMYVYTYIDCTYRMTACTYSIVKPSKAMDPTNQVDGMIPVIDTKPACSNPQKMLSGKPGNTFL